MNTPGERIAEKVASLIDIRRFRIPFDTPWDRDKFRSEIAKIINAEIAPLVEALRKIAVPELSGIPTIQVLTECRKIARDCLALAGQEPEEEA